MAHIDVPSLPQPDAPLQSPPDAADDEEPLTLQPEDAASEAAHADMPTHAQLDNTAPDPTHVDALSQALPAPIDCTAPWILLSDAPARSQRCPQTFHTADLKIFDLYMGFAEEYARRRLEAKAAAERAEPDQGQSAALGAAEGQKELVCEELVYA